ncbi:MAG: hypothetical protein JWR12_2428 [Mucilaginibacter sp.]|nr:hypothetical protein [Mucilaginibacter sp.]
MEKKKGKEFSKLITCRHCGNVSKMEIIGNVNDTHELNDPKYGFSGYYGTTYLILLCPSPACNKVNIVTYDWDEGMDSYEDIEYEFLYPQKNNYPIGLPDSILKAFMAAEKVKSIDVNAYATLMRRLLEMVCIDRKAKSGTLAAMLKDLHAKNEIPEKLVKVATGLKDFGNIGAHAGIGELTEKEIPILSTLCNAILEYVYSAPYLADLAEEKLKKITKIKSK